MGYRDRADAGDVLAGELAAYRGREDVLVLGLVRGGVPVAARVATALGAGLDALVVRKLGVPWAPEVAFGAVGSGGVRVLNPQIASTIDPEQVEAVTERESAELARREASYRPGRPALDLTDRIALIIDDGWATGATARAAVEVAHGLAANRVVAAAPVGSRESVSWLRDSADEVVCPLVPAHFGAVSRFYDRFGQVGDDEVRRLLGVR